MVLWMQRAYALDDKNLVTSLDEIGILRVRTKILSEEFEQSFKAPAILPRQCWLVASMIKECHNRLHHTGATTVLGVLREKFWIPKGRSLARKIIGQCVRCRRFKAKPVQTVPVGLPNNRVELRVKAFEVCGCDLAGPLYLRDETKVWVVLFTCAVYRAVHLEIVDSLSTESFIMALRRMIARRGRVREMYSDNGTNFVGAWNLIKASAVECELKVKWIFNVPSAPWWGGFFERLVGVMKTMLRASLGQALLDHVELTTLIIEVESLMNSRPISYFSDDPTELQPITPSMFIQEETTTNVPDLDAVDNNSLTRRVRYVLQVRKDLRERFRKEYLGRLVLKSTKSTSPVQVGELVWIVSNEKRINWVLGRVLECYEGKDGVVRAAKVKTTTGELLRPVQKLCKMEVGCSFDDTATLEKTDTNRTEPITPDVTYDETVVRDFEPEVESRSRCGRILRKPQVLDL